MFLASGGESVLAANGCLKGGLGAYSARYDGPGTFMPGTLSRPKVFASRGKCSSCAGTIGIGGPVGVTAPGVSGPWVLLL